MTPTEQQAAIADFRNRPIPICRDTAKLCLRLLEERLLTVEADRKAAEAARQNLTKLITEMRERMGETPLNSPQTCRQIAREGLP